MTDDSEFVSGVVDGMTVDQAVQEVMLKIGPIAKAQRSGGDGHSYNYRGRDTVVDALSPLMARFGVKVIPVGVSGVETGWVETGRKNPERLVSVVYTFQVRGPGGDSFEMQVFGEAMNNRDKASGAAMSYAYRYALESLFAIPTSAPDNEENNDDARPAAVGDDGMPLRDPKAAGPPIKAKQAADLASMLNSIEDQEAKTKAKYDFLRTFNIAKPADLPAAWFDEALRWVGAVVPEPFGTEPPGEPLSTPGPAGPAEADDLLQFMLLCSPTQAAKAQETLAEVGQWPIEDQDPKHHGTMLAMAKAAIEGVE